MSVSAIGLAALLASVLPATTDPCEVPRVMIVFDRSSSMVSGVTPDGSSKWQAATAAVQTLVNDYAGRIDFGLTVFPDPNACAPGSIVVDVAPANAGLIAALLSEPPPPSGNYTPIGETLTALLDEGLSWATTDDAYVLLVTDGWQYCDPYDPATRFLGVDAVSTLAMAGVDSFVLGLGDEVDVTNNNRMAVAGQTALPGCDPDQTDPAATDLCYFQTDTEGSLSAAFDDIAQTVVAEVCDGLDNDCDGLVDNVAPNDAALLHRVCRSLCGTGEETCIDGGWSACAAEGACDDGDACSVGDWCVAEVCDGTPRDCDDQDPCTADDCDPSSGCSHTPIPDCGTCASSCADDNPCTDDGCDATGACIFTPNDENSCDDGDPCTTNACFQGRCVAGPRVCDGNDAGEAGVERGCGCRQSGGPTATLAILLGLFALRRRRR